MEALEQQLMGIGLSLKASTLYINLLQLGSATMQELSSRAGIIRTTSYPLIEELIKTGLVSTTKSGKRTLYVAEDPSRLIVLVKKRLNAVRALAPTLQHILSGNAKRPVFEVYEGIDGVWRVYDDIIKGDHYTVKSFIPADDAVAIAGTKKIHDYIRRRVAKNISVRAIMQNTELIRKNYLKYDEAELRESRVINPNTFPMPVELSLYPEHNIAITSFAEPIGIIIRSKSIYRALDTMFELAWISSEKS